MTTILELADEYAKEYAKECFIGRPEAARKRLHAAIINAETEAHKAGMNAFATARWELGQGGTPAEFANMTNAHLNRDKTVAVANDYYWNEDMAQCPRGVKVQLLGKSGVAVYGQWNGVDDFWVAWAPLPKRRPN